VFVREAQAVGEMRRGYFLTGWAPQTTGYGVFLVYKESVKEEGGV